MILVLIKLKNFVYYVAKFVALNELAWKLNSLKLQVSQTKLRESTAL